MAKKVAKTPDNSPNREELFNMAVNAAKNKQRKPARMMFQRILNEDPKNERVMMWLAKIAPNPEQRRKWLERVVDLNPRNETAIKILDDMDVKETVARNRLYLRIGVGTYVAVVLVASVFILILNAAGAL